jgi:O-methyltransferase
MDSSAKISLRARASIHARSMRRILRRVWNPSLARLEAKYKQLQDHCDVNLSIAEDFRRRLELLLFEARNHLSHLAARIDEPTPARTQEGDDVPDPASDAASAIDKIERCRAQLDKLITYARGDFARSNELLNKELRSGAQLGPRTPFNPNFVIGMTGVRSDPDAHGDALYEVNMAIPPSYIRCVEDFAKTISTVASRYLTEQQRYFLAERLAWAAYPKYRFSDLGSPHLEDRAFIDVFKETANPGTWHSLDRKYLVNEMLKSVEHLPGDFVECGVWKGSTAVWLCRAAERRQRRVHLFDSWEGLSAPDPRVDGTHWQEGSLAVSLDAAQEYLKPYPSATFYQGWIPDRFPEVGGAKVAFLHIDVDLFRPTHDSIAYFYPRVVPGGIIICDDYNTFSCPGAKKAVDDFFAHRPEKVAILPTGQALVIKQ